MWSGEVRGEEVSVVTTGTAGHTEHLPLHLTLHITNNLEQVLIYPPIELVGAGLIAASGLSDTVPAGVDLLTAEEQGTDLTEGETLAGKVSEELTVWRVIAELATLLETGHTSNTLYQSPLVHLTGRVLTGALNRGAQAY